MKILLALLILSASKQALAVPNFCEKNGDIYFYNRQTRQMEMEKILDGDLVKKIHKKKITFIFKGSVGKISSGILKLRNNKKEEAITDFIKNYDIKMRDFYPFPPIKPSPNYVGYNNFLEFFIRPVRKSARPIILKRELMPAFADARYRGFNEIGGSVTDTKVVDEREVIVKNNRFKASYLLGGYKGNRLIPRRYRGQFEKSEKYQKIFKNGPMIIARLAPVDYHRFHFPLGGKILDVYRVKGDYFPVNKLYVDSDPDILFKNERVVNIIDTKEFGKLAYIEIGAVGVGKIVHTHPAHPLDDKSYQERVPNLRNDFLPLVPRGSLNVSRGDEKGYFQFGASTIVLLGEKGKWEVSSDIVQQTKRGCEVYLKLGELVGALKSSAKRK
ncbi:MAG: phosphatidylserine decarboxylase [Bacteriovoracaceae bacterium]